MNRILIVTYKTPFFLEHQLPCIATLCADDFQVEVIDNTPYSLPDVRAAIKEACEKHEASYVYLGEQNRCGSFSHAPALNLGFKRAVSENVSRLLILDHDLLPFKNFSIETLHTLEGILQSRGNTQYLAPVYLNIDLTAIDTLDFTPTIINGDSLDTGAQLHFYLNSLPKKAVRFVSQEHRYPNSSRFHEIIDNKMFHFIRGSNWGIPESPALSENKYKKRLKKLTQEYNILSKDFQLI